MSSSVASVDLSTAAAGSTGTMDWSGYGLPTGQSKPARLQLFNESGCGLRIVMSGSGRSFDLPAGGWMQDAMDLQPGERSLAYTVQYVIPNAPVATLLATYFGPGERSVGVSLGNSPIGITGNVATSTVNSLVADGSAAGTQVIEATPSGQGSSSLSLNNDGSGFEAVLSAGTVRKIRNVTRGDSGSTKAIITFGDAGDTSITTLHGTADLATTAAAVPASGVTAGTLGGSVLLPAASVQAGNLGASVAANPAALQAGAIAAAVTLAASQLTDGWSTLAGTTLGNCFWSQPLQASGGIKLFLAFVNGYENTTATPQSIQLPTAFEKSAIAINIGAGSTWNPKTSLSADITFSQTTWGTTTSSGTQNTRTGVEFSAVGHVTGAIHHVNLPSSMGSTVTGWFLLVGY